MPPGQNRKRSFMEGLRRRPRRLLLEIFCGVDVDEETQDLWISRFHDLIKNHLLPLIETDPLSDFARQATDEFRLAKKLSRSTPVCLSPGADKRQSMGDTSASIPHLDHSRKDLRPRPKDPTFLNGLHLDEPSVSCLSFSFFLSFFLFNHIINVLQFLFYCN